jgi:plastocyanin
MENKTLFTVLALFFGLLITNPLSAETHIIKFSGNEGEAYVPNRLSVQVGDTVVWEGLFAAYPLRSTLVPAGADRLDVTTGIEYVYVVKVPGTYRFQSDDYALLGMKGSLTTSPEPVQPWGDNTGGSPSLYLGTVIRNPVNYPGEAIGFTITEEQKITLKLLTLDGREVATLYKGIKSPGTHWVRLPRKNIPSGNYICELNGYSTDVMHLSLSRGKKYQAE